MRFNIALAPKKHPEVLTLQSTIGIFNEAIEALKREGKTPLARLLSAQVPTGEDDQIVRITLDNEHARAILRFSGLSC